MFTCSIRVYHCFKWLKSFHLFCGLLEFSQLNKWWLNMAWRGMQPKTTCTASLIVLISQLDGSSTKSAHHLWEPDLKMFDASAPLGSHKSVRSPARAVSTCSRPQVWCSFQLFKSMDWRMGNVSRRLGMVGGFPLQKQTSLGSSLSPGLRSIPPVWRSH